MGVRSATLWGYSSIIAGLMVGTGGSLSNIKRSGCMGTRTAGASDGVVS